MVIRALISRNGNEKQSKSFPLSLVEKTVESTVPYLQSKKTATQIEVFHENTRLQSVATPRLEIAQKDESHPNQKYYLILPK